MAQNDLNIANQSFPSFRTDLNNALSAIQTTHSGTSRPTGAVAGQIWLDTTTATSPTLKYYDGADDISLATIDHVGNTVNWLDSTVSITGLTTTATGTVLTLSDSSLTSSVNLILQNQKEIRFSETTANGTNYVGFKAPASLSADLTFTLPATDGTSGQVLTTNGSGVLSFATVGGSFADGTASSPSITFTDDTNTGIFRPTADTIAFTEGGTEARRINSDGNLALAKNIGLGGATPSTSGTGITFPATASGSTNANTLDDYEEGTFTVVYKPASGTITMFYTTGAYVKIGQIVFCEFSLSCNGSSSPSGTVKLDGLPFIVSATGGSNDEGGGGGQVQPNYAFPNDQTNVVTIRSTDEANIYDDGGNYLQASELAYGFNEGQGEFSLTYRTTA